MPIDPLFGLGPLDKAKDASAYVAQLKEHMATVHEVARHNLMVSYKVGQTVDINDPTKKKEGLQSCSAGGEERIVQRVSDLLYKVERMERAAGKRDRQSVLNQRLMIEPDPDAENKMASAKISNLLLNRLVIVTLTLC